MGEWRYVSYVRRGLSHIQEGIVCQDYICVVDKEDYFVAALSDGLGSLKYSEVASEIATKTVCKVFENLNCDGKELRGYLLGCIVENIQKEADRRGLQLKEMDCTLVFVYIDKKKSTGIIGRLGDSALCVFSEKRTIALNDGNKSANGTNAILDRDAIENFSIDGFDCNRDKIKGFILSSDGLENILYTKGSTKVNKAAEEYINVLVNSDKPEDEVKRMVGKIVNVPNSPFDDDISVVIVACNDTPISLPEDATWLCKCGCRNPLYATYCIECNADFTVLYENIRFREHGGKAAFFEKINKNPYEEKKILGLERGSELDRNRKNDFSPQRVRENDSAKKGASLQREQESVGVKNSSREQRLVYNKKELSSSYGDSESIQNRKNGESKASKREFEKKTHLSMSESRDHNDAGNREKTVTEDKSLDVPNRDEGFDEMKSIRNKKNWLGVYFMFGLTLGILFSCVFLVNTIRKKNKNVEELNSQMLVLGNEKNEKIEELNSQMIILGKEKDEEIEELNSQINILENEKNEKIEELSSQIIILEKEKQELEEKKDSSNSMTDGDNPWRILENGACFLGNVAENGLPDGIGVLLDENTYYVGQFDQGKKNGDFTIIDSNGIEYTSFVNDTKEEKVTQETTSNGFNDNSENLIYKTLVDAKLWKEAGSDSTLVVELNAGTLITVIDGSDTIIGIDEWVQIKTVDGLYEGWILKSLIGNKDI